MPIRLAARPESAARRIAAGLGGTDASADKTMTAPGREGSGDEIDILHHHQKWFFMMSSILSDDGVGVVRLAPLPSHGEAVQPVAHAVIGADEGQEPGI